MGIGGRLNGSQAARQSAGAGKGENIMRVECLEKGINYVLYIPPCDIYEVAGKCGLDIFDSALDITPEEAQIIALLKLERRKFLSKKCFAKMEEAS